MCSRARPGAPRPPRPDKVVVRLETWESRHVNPEGEIVEVLGRARDPGVDMLSIIRKIPSSDANFRATCCDEADGDSGNSRNRA